MKAWWAAETDDWGFCVHGETEGEARDRALRCEPSGFWEYEHITVRQLPWMDGRPFTFGQLVKAGIIRFNEDGTPASKGMWCSEKSIK